MGFLGKLVDDVLDIPEKVIRTPVRVICSVTGGHMYSSGWYRENGRWFRKCDFCGRRSYA